MCLLHSEGLDTWVRSNMLHYSGINVGRFRTEWRKRMEENVWKGRTKTMLLKNRPHKLMLLFSSHQVLNVPEF